MFQNSATLLGTSINVYALMKTKPILGISFRNTDLVPAIWICGILVIPALDYDSHKSFPYLFQYFFSSLQYFIQDNATCSTESFSALGNILKKIKNKIRRKLLKTFLISSHNLLTIELKCLFVPLQKAKQWWCCQIINFSFPSLVFYPLDWLSN